MSYALLKKADGRRDELESAKEYPLRAAPVAPNNGNVIVFEGVGKRYGDSEALCTIDLAVREGEFLSLLGPSGSGKTTLLNMIAGAVAPTRGHVWLNGRDVSSVPPRERGLGMVFQSYALLPHMNVFDNVAFPLRIRGLGKDEIARRVSNTLERVGLAGYEQRKPGELSGGQQQRVGIARCIVYSPSVILMDEPLGALDKKLREQLQAEIKRLHRDLGTTVVYVTHDQEEALDLSDRVCLMNRGRIEQIGTPDELYFEPANEFVADFVGESNLIRGRVTAEGTVTTEEGHFIYVRRRDGHPIGSHVKVLVRPEKIRMMDQDTHAAASCLQNVCVGTITQTAFVGGMTRIEIRCDGGMQVRIKAVSSRAADCPPVGVQVTVRWSANDSVVLAG